MLLPFQNCECVTLPQFYGAPVRTIVSTCLFLKINQNNISVPRPRPVTKYTLSMCVDWKHLMWVRFKRRSFEGWTNVSVHNYTQKLFCWKSVTVDDLLPKI